MQVNIYVLFQMISLGLLFVLFVTKAYKRSATLAIEIISLFLASNCFFVCGLNIAIAIMMSGTILSLILVLMRIERNIFFYE